MNRLPVIRAGRVKGVELFLVKWYPFPASRKLLFREVVSPHPYQGWVRLVNGYLDVWVSYHQTTRNTGTGPRGGATRPRGDETSPSGRATNHEAATHSSNRVVSVTRVSLRTTPHDRDRSCRSLTCHCCPRSSLVAITKVTKTKNSCTFRPHSLSTKYYQSLPSFCTAPSCASGELSSWK